MGRTFLDQGITFALGGVERPFPLDLIPRIVTAQEWKVVQTGVPQRVRALEAFLADCYGPGRIFDDGVVPRRLVTTSPHFHRQVAGHGRPGRRPDRHLRCRPDPRRARRFPGAGGQRPGAVRGFLRAGEPAGRLAGALRGRRRSADPLGGRISGPPAGRAPRGQPVERQRPDGRRAHPRCLQLRLLRAHPAGPRDGRRTGRGPRPDLPQQPGLRPHHGRRDAGARHLPPARRRVPGPDAVPARFDARLARADQRSQGRQSDHRQRSRQRHRRRQARLHLRAGHHPVLPERRADPAQRRHLPDGGAGPPGVRARAPGRAGDQAGRRLRRQGHRHRFPGRLVNAVQGPGGDPGEPAGLDRPAGDRAVHRTDADRRQDAASARRPAAVRRQRRQLGLGAARRFDQGRAARGRAGGQFVPGRRFEGHLGAGRSGRAGGADQGPGRRRRGRRTV